MNIYNLNGHLSQKEVYVNPYERVRYGRTEHVTDHYRSYPRR